MAVPLLEAVAPPERLIADKAHDAGGPRRRLGARRVEAVVPSTASRTVPHPLDRRAYARRNAAERLVGRLESRRRVATRYDRLARNHLAGLALIAVVTEWAK
jgi:transposase